MQESVERHNQATARFIEQANTLNDGEGHDRNLVSAGLMAAAGLYAAFMHMEHVKDPAETVGALQENLARTHRGLAQCTDRFMQLARETRGDQALTFSQISAALLAASAIYATFSLAGNNGYLQDDGVRKVTEKFGELLATVTAGHLPGEKLHPLIQTYGRNLAAVQQMKRRELEAKGYDIARPSPPPGAGA